LGVIEEMSEYGYSVGTSVGTLSGYLCRNQIEAVVNYIGYFFSCTCILKFCNHLCTYNSDNPDLQFLKFCELSHARIFVEMESFTASIWFLQRYPDNVPTEVPTL
jgi:hypothetical protein